MKEVIKKFIIKVFTRQAKKIIAKHKPSVVVVTGSVGKTTTKLAISTVLQEKLSVQYQVGNYNAPISVPFIFSGQTIPNLVNPFGWFGAWLKGQKVLAGKYPYDVVVVELGTDAPGDIIAFKDVLHADIAVVSAVSPEHMEFFKDLDAVAAEELAVAQFSNIVLVNADDINPDFVDKYIPKDKTVIGYGLKNGDYKGNFKSLQNGTQLKVDIDGVQKAISEIGLLAKHSLKSAVAAVAVADIMGLNKDQISAGLARLTSPAGRMNVLKGIKNSTIIDDTYNSSPLAVQAALETLYETESPQRIAILGRMNELGDHSKEAHEQIGSLCDPNKLDMLVTIADDANEYLAGKAEKRGCKVKRFNSPIEASEYVATIVQDGAVILAKGSQNGVFAEEAVKKLLADPNDANKLVRQNAFWLKKKRAQFDIK